MGITSIKQVYSAIIIIAGCVFAIYGRSFLREIVELRFDTYLLHLFFSYSWWLVPVVAVTGLMFGFRSLLSNLGLDRGFLRGFGIAALCVIPMMAGSAILGKLNSNIEFMALLQKTLLAGFTEELLFRGFVFGLLFSKIRWGFIPAALPGAVIFALAHLYQGSGFADSAGIFFVTFIGSLWFAWLYIEWDNNLWVPIWMHALMNLSWMLFYTDHTALGNMSSNIFRALTIAVSVMLTIAYCRKRKSFRINKTNLFLNQPIFENK